MPRKKNKRKERQAEKAKAQPKPTRVYSIGHAPIASSHAIIALLAGAMLKKGPTDDEAPMQGLAPCTTPQKRK